MGGSSHFAEVFFDNVRVPIKNRLGDEGKGWGVTISALAHERSGISEIAGLVRDLEEMVELAKNTQKNGRPASRIPTSAVVWRARPPSSRGCVSTASAF